MTQAVVVAVALTIGVSGAWAELCAKCKDGMYTADSKRCPECKQGWTASGMYQLCKKCSARLGQCERCRAKLEAVKKPSKEVVNPAADEKAKAQELTGAWRLASWVSPDDADKVVAVEFPCTIVFEQGKVRGRAPVNGYGSQEPFTVGAGNSISFGRLMATQMAAADDKLNKAEGRYFQLLEKVKTYKPEKDKLAFMGKDGKQILLFVKQP